MHKHGKESGFDAAGWGILNAWQYYNTTGADIATSMTPTYNWLGNGEKLRSFILGELSGGMPRSSIGAGIGTTVAPGRTGKWDYNWTEPTLNQFVSWLKSEEGGNIPRVDFWRADIDYNWPANGTASWVFSAAQMFLS
eukprot:Hpha_TRINITY_DN8738_c0_g1::TRINITY_DN8738_c0_g1_i2::g.45172::m.45172